MYSIVVLDKMSIFEQLKVEEALLRADTGNWCLISSGAPPAIVMGISGKPEKLINMQKVKDDGINIIKRFSGGGTVYIDEQTIFVTIITNGSATPRSILEFTKSIYAPFFSDTFDLQENDYVFGKMKFGGNAQYIQRNRWLHHTSFLWDFDPKKMDYLLMPEKQPDYRNQRSHLEFLCSLKDRYKCKADFIEKIKHHFIKKVGGSEQKLPPDLLTRLHRTSTQYWEQT